MIYIKKDLIAQMIEHSKKEFPNEACGILAGKEGKVEKIYPMTNTDRSAQTFFMDPREQLKVMKEIRSLGLEMIGIYHSHPVSLAYPSTRDVELAYYSHVSYIIVSLKDKDNPKIRSFRIEEGKISEEEIKIV
ncbi:MAG: M67 family metallopeptidase [Candidatus Omnitrophica bacterium]|nr:M67 family metallopeptidase [Candidatus Omnitrophota bacterium]